MTHPQLFDIDKEAPINKKGKRYACLHCHGKKTVTYLEETKDWTCSRCGRINVGRNQKDNVAKTDN